MRVVVTGGAGFIGGATVRRLLALGVDVLALDRAVERAEPLLAAGATVLRDELDDVAALADRFRGADAVVHAAGAFRVGPHASRATRDGGVERPRDDPRPRRGAGGRRAARRPRVHLRDLRQHPRPRRGRGVPPAGGDPFLSWYDETKHRAHVEAEARRAAGTPVSIVLLGAAYGPGDPSGLGDQLRRAALGRLPAIGSPTLGVSWTHVDDLADGIARVVRDAPPGQDWNLGGEIGTLRDGIEAACRASGRRPPRLTAPRGALLALARLGPGVCARLGFPANLEEAVRCTDGVTFWGTHAKAARVLGYAPRPVADGFAETFGGL
jgi:dihydroflavonol-4-reductase